MKHFYKSLLVFILVFFALKNTAYSQCGLAGFNFGTYGASSGTTFLTIPNFSPGTYFTWSVLSGASYGVSTCGAPIDSQLSVYNNAFVLTHYNDDNGFYCLGGSASLDGITPNFSAYMYVQVSQYYCQPGGSSSINVYIRQNNNLAFTSSAAAMCSGQTRVLSATPAPVGSSQPGAGDLGTFSGLGVSGNVFTAPFVGVPTNFTITYTFGFCSTTQVITVNPLPSIDIQPFGSGYICRGGSESLSVSGASSYTWSTGSNALSITVNPTVNTVYSASGTNVNGCINSGSITVGVSTNPSITAISGNAKLCTSASTVIGATSAGNAVSWYTVSAGGTALSTSVSTNNYTASPVNTSTYYAEAVSNNVTTFTQTFNFIGAPQSFVVPAGVNTLSLSVKGSQGGTAVYAGGYGGLAKGVLTVTPAQVLNIYVGGMGILGYGGYNGGGDGGLGSANNYGAGGGGASDIRVGGTALANRIIVGGGGGGSAASLANSAAGPGFGGGGAACASPLGVGGDGGNGCALGGNGACAGGTAPSYGTGGAGGGLTSGGGVAGSSSGSYGQAGALGQGGDGGGAVGTFGGGGGGVNGAGGGGGGYYGGSGGMSGAFGCHGNGGGGSSYASGVLTSVSFSNGAAYTGNGIVTIIYTVSVPCSSSPRSPVTVSITPNLVVQGNGNNVPQGVATNTNNNTNFGTASSKTFSLSASGNGTLLINSINFTGPNAAQFSVTTVPSTAITSGTTGMVITLTPTNTGISTATVNILSNDCSFPTYSFVITASTTPASALNFDGINDFVSISHTSSLNAFPLTAETWVKTGFAGGFPLSPGLVGKYASASFNGWSLHLINGVVSGFYFGNALNYVSYPITTTVSIADNNWHHVALVVDATGGRIYIDGVQSSSVHPWVGTPSAPTTAQNVLIGSYDLNLPGSFDETRIWNTARTQCQIQQFMNAEITSTASGLIANYHFNQGIPSGSNSVLPYNTLTDAAGSNNGTLINFALNGASSNWVSPGSVVSGFTTAAVINASIVVSGNGNNVPMGVVTNTNNNTDFGTNASKTFSIANAGAASTLNIGGIYFTGPNAAQFSITTVPSTAITTGTTGFAITLTPTNTGISTATVFIPTNDCTNPTYSFVITASTTPASALALDGNDYITAPNMALSGQPFTVEFWAKRNAAVNHNFIFSQGSQAVNQGLHIGFYLASNTFNFGFFSNDLSYPSADLLWHHWACVYTGISGVKNRFIYLDGVLVASDISPSHFLGSGPVTIGSTAWLPASQGLEGNLDELRVWSQARTQCQIQTFMNAEITSTASGLIANYHFNQGIPSGNNLLAPYNTLIDAAGANTGTLTNFALTGTLSNWVSPGGVTNGFTTTSAPTASIVVSGNGNNVPQGVVTSTNNNTDFGINTSKTFSISNSSGTLNINPIFFTGADATQFSIATTPASLILAGGGTSFVIVHTPTAVGNASAIVNIPSNDCTNPTFSFVITASTTPANALNLDGINDFVNVANSAPLNFGTGDLTLEAYYKSNVSNPNYSGIVCKATNGFMTGYQLVLVNNRIAAELGNGATYLSDGDGLYGVTTLSNNVWHHLSMVVNRSQNNIKLYVNGLLEANVTNTIISTLNVTNAANLFIGKERTSAFFVNGNIDEVRIWNTARTQCQIQQFMNCEIPTTAVGLVANYHFNQGIPSGSNSVLPYNTLSDAAGINTGALTNFALNGAASNWVSPGGVVNGFTTAAVINASIVLSGNGINVPMGVATNTNNNTDFGTNASRTFSITNAGAASTLNIGAIYFTGPNAAQFSVTTVPSTAITTGTTGFVITLTPTNTGISTATVNISTNDCTNPTFSFVITASTTPAAALDFDGTNDYVNLGNTAALKNPTGITAECWAFRSSWAGNYTILGNAQFAGYKIKANGTTLNATTYRNSGFGVAAGTALSSITPGWHHVALTYDGRYTNIYIDGILTGTDDAGGTYPITYIANSTILGAEVGAGAVPLGDYFGGKLDEVRFWNVVRTQCQIQQFMNCEIPTTAVGLVANYHFNQGIPSGSNSVLPYNTLTDAAGANTGTLTNFALTGAASNWVSPGGVVSGFTTAAVINASIVVSGNGINVPMGVATNTNNNTDFGTNASRTFSIANAGAASTLNIGAIYFTGPNAAQFSVTTVPSTAITTGTTGFVITLTPTNTGVSSATVNIPTNDCTNPTFSFVITASTTPASAINFDGPLDVVNCGSDPSLDITTGSWEAWVKLSTLGSNSRIFFKENVDGGGSGTYESYYLGASGKFQGDIKIGGTNYVVVGATSPVINTWYHVATTYDGTFLKLYVNGILDGVLNVSGGSMNPGTGRLSLGGSISNPASSGLTGMIDEARLWNVARTQCQIQQFMNCEIPTTAIGLVSNYHFNQGIPSGSNSVLPYNILTDAAGANTGTLTNFALNGATSNWVSPGGVVSGFTTTAVINASIVVSGNGISVPMGVVTTTNNNTDFGTNASRTFSIANAGAASTLNIGAIYFTGPNAAQFSVTTAPANSLTVGGSSFVITLTPTNTGVSSATVNILTNDCTNPTFSFVITASTTPASALSFDGVNDNVQANLFSTNTSSVTLEGWFNWSGVNGNVQVLMHNGNTGGNGYGLFLPAGSNVVNLILGGIFTGSASYTLTPSVWTKLSLVINNGTQYLYANGVLASTYGIPGIAVPSGSFCIGSNLAGSQNFNGKIDEVRFWNKALTQCEIQTYLSSEITTTATSLAANYHFNQGIPSGNNSLAPYNTLIDAAGANTATLNNFALTGATSNWVNPGGVISGSNTPSVISATLSASGNGNPILAGSTTPTITNHTDFAGVATRTFVVTNTGTTTLHVAQPFISGANASEFSVNVIATATTIAPSASLSFVVVFTPTLSGTRVATVNILSNDCGTPLYQFAIKGIPPPADAFHFDGINDFATGALLSPANNSVTVQARVRNTGGTGFNQFIALNGSTNSYGLAMTVGGFLASYNSISGFNTSTYTIPTNTWVALAAVYKDNIGRLYANGVQVHAFQYASLAVPAGSFVIGQNGSGGEVFKGQMDEVLFWNKALTQCQIQSNLTSEIPTSAPNLLANYHFNQGSHGLGNPTVTTITDASGNNNTLTLANVALSGTISNWFSPGGVTAGNTVVTTPTANINVSGNGNPIIAGSAVPSTSNSTSFGYLCVNVPTVTKTYSVSNAGSSTMNLHVMLLASNNFTLGSYNTTLAAAGSATFPITLSTATIGVNTNTVIITSNDCSVPEFSFVINGTVTALPSVTANATSTLLCNGQTVTVNGSGANNYTWTASVGTATNAVAFTPSTTANYTVVGTSTLTGCTSTNISIVTISVNPLPTLTANATSTAICFGQTVSVFGFGANTFTWAVPSGTVPLNGIPFTPTATVTYSLSGTNTITGCSAINTATTAVTVNTLPVVSGTASNPVVCIGGTTSLNGSGANTYTWTGGVNNGVAFIPTVTANYTVSGTSAAGCTSTNNPVITITVNPLPVVSGTISNPVICFGATTSLNGGGALTYTWVSATGSVANAAAFTPTANTSYSIVGTSTAGCTSTNVVVQSVTVNPLPVVSGTAANPVICIGGTTALNASGANTFTWTTPNGTVANIAAFSPTATNAYSLTGTSLAGCTSTNNAVITITVNALPNVLANTSSSAVCLGFSTSVSGSGANTYTWTAPVGNVTNNVAFTPTSTGVYSVTGTDVNGCQNSNTISITVNQNPTVSATVSSSVVCLGGTITLNGSGATSYTWSNGVADNTVFSPTSTASYSVIGTNSFGCVSNNTAVVSVTVNSLPSLTVSPSNSVICYSGTVALNASGAVTYTWSNGIANNASFIPGTTGTINYTVTGTDANGCNNTATVSLLVNSLPTITVVSSNTLCIGEQATLTANGADTYSWISVSQSGSSIAVSPTTTATYTIIGTYTNGCFNDTTFTQTVIDCSKTLLAETALTHVSCKSKNDGKIVITPSVSYTNKKISYVWDQNLCPSGTCDTIKDLKAGTYNVRMVVNYTIGATNLGKTDTLVLNPLTILDVNPSCDIEVFTGFTPNADGVNDKWIIKNLELYPKNSVTIFNRWGVQLANIKGYDNKDKVWPSDDALKNLIAGTYYYVIELGDGSAPIKGWVEIIKE